MIRKEIVQQLVGTGRWSEQAARLAERAGYKCEYCSLQFFESAVNYKQWHEDHLVPRIKGGDDSFDNLVASCRSCNVDFKARWDPRDKAGKDAPRADLIRVASDYIAERKRLVEAEIKTFLEIVK